MRMNTQQILFFRNVPMLNAAADDGFIQRDSATIATLRTQFH